MLGLVSPGQFWSDSMLVPKYYLYILMKISDIICVIKQYLFVNKIELYKQSEPERHWSYKDVILYGSTDCIFKLCEIFCVLLTKLAHAFTSNL